MHALGQTVAVYSESGGATKTTTAVSLAAVAAAEGMRVTLCDLDPRGAATRWLGAEAAEPGLDMSAIIGRDDPDGYADDLAVPAGPTWPTTLRVIPATRALSTYEAIRTDGQELRLARALDGHDADLVVIDCPNRQGGPLTQNALYAAAGVLIACKPDTDGREGVEGAMATLTRHHANLDRLGARRTASILGIVVGNARDTVTPRIETHTLRELHAAYGALVLSPVVPQRTIVREARETGEWYGTYPAAAPVVAAYTTIAHRILKEHS